MHIIQKSNEAWMCRKKGFYEEQSKVSLKEMLETRHGQKQVFYLQNKVKIE